MVFNVSFCFNSFVLLFFCCLIFSGVSYVFFNSFFIVSNVLLCFFVCYYFLYVFL